jgi:hypothetical protein
MIFKPLGGVVRVDDTATVRLGDRSHSSDEVLVTGLGAPESDKAPTVTSREAHGGQPAGLQI